MAMKLSQKQRIFVEAYDGDSAYAAQVAGFTGHPSYLKQQGDKLLNEPSIIEAIKNRTKFMTTLKKTIATREERQQIWTDIMRNEDPHRIEELDSNGVPIPVTNIPLLTRMKASELLGKSEADFIDKVETTVTHSLSDLVMQSYKLTKEDDLSIEAIEAEYHKAKETNTVPTVNPVPTNSPIQDLEDLI